MRFSIQLKLICRCLIMVLPLVTSMVFAEALESKEFIANQNCAAAGTAFGPSGVTNTGSLNTSSRLFWVGDTDRHGDRTLSAYEVGLNGSISSVPEWEAGSRVDAQNPHTERVIVTYNPHAEAISGGALQGAGVAFRFPNDYTNVDPLVEISSAAVRGILSHAPYSADASVSSEIANNQTYGEALVDYLRGARTNEGAGLDFKVRSRVLGEIENSGPRYLKVPGASFAEDLEVKSYADFRRVYSNRDGVVYVGASDGMLHGFDENTGDEVLAYLPTSAYDRLFELTTAGDKFRDFVGGSLNIIDVFMDDMDDPYSNVHGLWRSALVSSVGDGGQMVFALDVTDPSQFDEANASNIVLWEFGDVDDVDMGYIYGRPQIAKMANGTWAAVFGNGYNNTEADGNASSSGHAVLYIIDVETGDLIRKIDTMAGDVATPNGLAAPLLIDENADHIVDLIYAGDLLGNLWKFDVSSVLPSAWSSAYSSAGAPNPLFTTASNQPITTQPQASIHPDSHAGYLIFFGTGQSPRRDGSDQLVRPSQSFYSIWDKNQASLETFTSLNLLTQKITAQHSVSLRSNADDVFDEELILRSVSDFEIDWDTHSGWKLDLLSAIDRDSDNTRSFNEVHVGSAILRNGRVIFMTRVPQSVKCESAGSGFLMVLNYRNGGALGGVPFDVRGDAEYISKGNSVSGRAYGAGFMSAISLFPGGSEDVVLVSGENGEKELIRLSVGSSSYGRQSWRQLDY